MRPRLRCSQAARRVWWQALLGLLLVAGPAAPSSGRGHLPNFFLILTDDMTPAMLDHMPRTAARLRARAVELSQAYAQVNICAPGRALLLSGKYAQSTGIYELAQAEPAFRASEHQTLATLLQDGGYRTLLAGKYMNGYEDPTRVPPGWDDWLAGWHVATRRVDPSLSDDGVPVDGVGHTSEILGQHVRAFIQAADQRPFLAVLAVPEPHTPHIVPQRHSTLFASAKAPRPPSFNEPDIADKPAHAQLPLLTASQVKSVDQRWRGALRSLQLVDEQIDQIVQILPTNTYVIFTSDNGYFYGQHRIPDKKHHMYLAGSRVPLMIIGPSTTRTTLNKLVSLADITPTLLDLAGLPVPPDLDGRSLAPLLADPGSPWRRSLPFARHIPEPAGIGVRAGRYFYAEFADGEVELYDLKHDPHQLSNLALSPAQAARRDALAALARDLASCSGDACREIDSRPVP